MASRERKVTGRLVRQGEEERAFDREFWSSMTGEERVDQLWDMVNKAREWKGLDGDEPRLQRSVGRLVPPSKRHYRS